MHRVAAENRAQDHRRFGFSELGKIHPSLNWACKDHASVADRVVGGLVAEPKEQWDGKPYLAYSTGAGALYRAHVERFLDSPLARPYRGKVQLIFTSPPFPLNRKKKYGNRQGQAYLQWLSELAPKLAEMLRPDGSIVLELGNAWEPGRPVMSTLALQALLKFQETGKLSLCEQFVVHNPARLPSPAQWVNVERIRVKDAYTNVWWLSPVDRPKANNRNVLIDYSDAMKRLLKTKTYNAGARPSEHKIGETSFLANNGGAIPSNVLTFANTRSTDSYLAYCKAVGLELHPARMQPEVAAFFVNFLTEKNDLVLDPFAGSNTTGAVAEALGRRWIGTEPDASYIVGSLGRFAHELQSAAPDAGKAELPALT